MLVAHKFPTNKENMSHSRWYHWPNFNHLAE